MNKKDAIGYLVLTAILIIGYWIGGFTGGIISGAAGNSILLVAVGKRVAAKAAARIDKNIKDIIVNIHNQADGTEEA